MVNDGLGLQLDIAVEIVAPALVQIVGREALAMVVYLPAGWADRLAVDVHSGLAGGAPALLEVARRAGGGDILPAGPAALGARNHVIESQFLVRSAIDAAESVAEEQVESGERRIFIRADELAKRDDR